MNRRLLLVVWLVGIVSATSWAQSVFDGTWRIRQEATKISRKPLVFAIVDGIYDCLSCNPKIHVPADGQDHSVSSEYFDSINVRVLGLNSIEVQNKRRGKNVFEQTLTSSNDGKTLTIETREAAEKAGDWITRESTATRLSRAAAGTNSVSGSWQIQQTRSSENDLLTTYEMKGNELKMSAPTGESYAAALDGKDYPAKGSFAYNAVSLRKIDGHTIEETDKMNGRVLSVWTMSVSADRKTMTEVARYPKSGQVITYVADKQ